MTTRRTDITAAALTTLVVLTFFATHEGWNVPLIGNSHRCAAGVITLLGVATCSLGNPSRESRTRILMMLGVIATVLAAIALWTGSPTPLSLLVLDIVLLWGASTLGHTQSQHHAPLAH